ncbi:ribonuclease H-like domain-containing protein [Tanacetum coccineum]
MTSLYIIKALEIPEYFEKNVLKAQLQDKDTTIYNSLFDGVPYHCVRLVPFGKAKKSSHQPKAEDTNQEKLYLLYMDLCGPKHVASINRKRYILVIVDDYSRFTWVRLLRSKDEA